MYVVVCLLLDVSWLLCVDACLLVYRLFVVVVFKVCSLFGVCWVVCGVCHSVCLGCLLLGACCVLGVGCKLLVVVRWSSCVVCRVSVGVV